MCEQYDDADKTLEPLRYLGQRVDGSKSRRHEKLAAQVVRNDNEITDDDLEGYKHISLDKSNFKNETPEERKIEEICGFWYVR